MRSWSNKKDGYYINAKFTISMDHDLTYIIGKIYNSSMSSRTRLMMKKDA